MSGHLSHAYDRIIKYFILCKKSCLPIKHESIIPKASTTIDRRLYMITTLLMIINILTILATIGWNNTDIAVLLVISVSNDVIVDMHITTPQAGQPSKKFNPSPMNFDKPET